MPCTTGRSSHALKTPGCVDASDCCRTTSAFACRPYSECASECAPAGTPAAGVDAGYVWYSDNANNRTVAIGLSEMKVIGEVDTLGDKPYPLDRVSQSTSVVSTRTSTGVHLLDNNTQETLGFISLEHKPCSTTANMTTGMAVIGDGETAHSNGNRLVNTLINSHTLDIVDTFAETAGGFTNAGGPLASGHPFWFDNRHFVTSNRSARQVSIWNIHDPASAVNGTTGVVATSSSVHHFKSIGNGYFYGSLEGAPAEGVAPGLAIFNFDGTTLSHVEILMADANLATGTAFPAGISSFDDRIGTMGAHHADTDPENTQYVYQGTNIEDDSAVDTGVTVVYELNPGLAGDYSDTRIVSIVHSGIGAGHTTFGPKHDRAIVTNHDDGFLTVIDTATLTKVQDVPLPFITTNPKKEQAHTAKVGSSGDNYYGMAPYDAVFYRLDLRTLEVTAQLDVQTQIANTGTPPYLIQGTFIN